MEGQGTNPEADFRAEIAKLQAGKKVFPQQFLFLGDASEVDFSLPNGWRPTMVFSTARLIQYKGASEGYTVSQHLGVSTVTFEVASTPSAAKFAIWAELDL